MDTQGRICVSHGQRRYRLVRACKDEYVEALLGGLMMSVDEPMGMHGSIGFMRYDGSSECHQTTCNAPIAKHASDFALLSDILSTLYRWFHMEVARFNCEHTILLINGVEGLLKGCEWIIQPVAQQAFMDVNSAAEKTRPAEEMEGELLALGADLDKLIE